MTPIRIGVLGIGKIARDQHLPALAANAAFDLAACASRNAKVDGVDNFPDLAAMLEGRPDLDAISICTPPQAHFAAARDALLRGKHVMLEKPPCETTREFHALAEIARRAGKTLFQTWHSRQAAGVAAAKQWLSTRPLKRGRISWKEDVRYWHPGQTWIWEAGGFGVFDPGINGLSILTEILAPDVVVKRAHLDVPSNCQSPIAANLTLETVDGAPISAEFDFRQTGPQSWDIELECDDGVLKLAQGGEVLSINGAAILTQSAGEYPGLYRRFAELIHAGASDVDVRPFELVADAFLVGSRVSVEPFIE